MSVAVGRRPEVGHVGGVSIRAAAVLLVYAAFLVAAGGITAMHTKAAAAPSASRAAACDGERWTVKTLQDRPLLRPARSVTLHYLATRTAPARLPLARLPFERNAFTVYAAVTLLQPQLDGDIHVLLKSDQTRMITETPDPACTTEAPADLRAAMTGARAQVRVCRTAKVTGVAFFDSEHGQTGAAPNGIELHPLLGFHCLRR